MSPRFFYRADCTFKRHVDIKFKRHRNREKGCRVGEDGEWTSAILPKLPIKHGVDSVCVAQAQEVPSHKHPQKYLYDEYITFVTNIQLHLNNVVPDVT